MMQMPQMPQMPPVPPIPPSGPITIYTKAPALFAPRKIIAIKNRRTKAGELQYSVIYDGEQGSKGHWFPATQLKCTDLIEAFEQNRATNKPDKRPEEIIGLVDQNVDAFSFIVRYAGSVKPKVVSRSFLHKHAPQLLLEFYERNIVFGAKPEPKKRVKKPANPEQSAEPEEAPPQDLAGAQEEPGAPEKEAAGEPTQ